MRKGRKALGNQTKDGRNTNMDTPTLDHGSSSLSIVNNDQDNEETVRVH